MEGGQILDEKVYNVSFKNTYIASNETIKLYANYIQKILMQKLLRIINESVFSFDNQTLYLISKTLLFNTKALSWLHAKQQIASS